MKRLWKFRRNVYGDEINTLRCRSLWYWGSGKWFWQWYRCPIPNKNAFAEFSGTRRELREFLGGE